MINVLTSIINIFALKTMILFVNGYPEQVVVDYLNMYISGSDIWKLKSKMHYLFSKYSRLYLQMKNHSTIVSSWQNPVFKSL